MLSRLRDLLREVLTSPLIQFGETTVTLLWMLQLLLAFFIVLIVSRTLKTFLKYHLLARLQVDLSSREAVSTFVSYIIGFIGFFIVLQSTGFDFSSLILIAGSLGVGIGFGLQNVANDIISGLSLLLDHKLKVGDFVEFDDISGNITGIFTRSTVIHTIYDQDVIVPNSYLTACKLTNWTLGNTGVWIAIQVPVSESSDPLIVTEVLLNCAALEPGVASLPKPQVLFKGIQKDAYNFELRVWTSALGQYYLLESSLYYAVEYHLRQANIRLPSEGIRLEQKEPFWIVADRDSWQKAQQRQQATQPSWVESQTGLYLHDYLRQVPYFEHFNAIEIRHLIEQGYRQRLAAGETLFREGEPGDTFYIILSGAVNIFVEQLDRSLQTLGRGQFFGELALMLGIPRTASVQAITDTVLFAINQQGFQQLLQNQPKIGTRIIEEFQKHQAELEARKQDLEALGLISPQEHPNMMIWVRQRLQQLFNI